MTVINSQLPAQWARLTGKKAANTGSKGLTFLYLQVVLYFLLTYVILSTIVQVAVAMCAKAYPSDERVVDSNPA